MLSLFISWLGNLNIYRMEIGLRQLSNILEISYGNLGKVVREMNIDIRKTKSNTHVELSDFIKCLNGDFYKKIITKAKSNMSRTAMLNDLNERNEEGERRIEGIKNKEKSKKEIKKKIVETSEEISDMIKDSFFYENVGKYIIHVGPTSSGKTYNATEAIKVATGKCAYLSPLRLLAWEVFEKLKDTPNSCNLLTGEDKVSNDSNVTSSTIEMANYSTYHEVVVIDETFMIGDPYRGKSWMKAILNIQAETVHLILNDESLHLIKSILDLTNRNYEVIRYTRKVPIYFAESPILDYKNLPDKTLVVVFSRKSAIFTKLKLEELGIKTSILYGNLPPETKKSQIRKFIDGENKVCVTTDVIGMGLNVPCDYVCFAEITKFDGTENRPLNTIEVRQIGGRAGRYLLSDKGIITATSQQSLEYLESEYQLEYKVEKANYALDDWMIDYLHGDTMADKLYFFSKLDIIPASLKEHIQKQSVNAYLEILEYNNSINILDDMMIWKLINLPVSKNNSSYFSYIVNKMVMEEYIDEPSIYVGEINNNDDLSYAEDKCKEIDLYLSAIRSSFLKRYFVNAEVKILEHREHLISMIDVYLLDQKKMTAKPCVNCKTNIGYDNPHRYCEPCYEEYKNYKNFKSDVW